MKLYYCLVLGGGKWLLWHNYHIHHYRDKQSTQSALPRDCRVETDPLLGWVEVVENGSYYLPTATCKNSHTLKSVTLRQIKHMYLHPQRRILPLWKSSEDFLSHCTICLHDTMLPVSCTVQAICHQSQSQRLFDMALIKTDTNLSNKGITAHKAKLTQLAGMFI